PNIASRLPEQHQQPHSPVTICSTLQSIESEILSYQESLPPIRFAQASKPRSKPQD
ncbi:hypothetical protein CEXT_208951, partial [Caerostris extrusa]